MASIEPSSTEPPRTDAVPESYAINVTDECIHVWEYRVSVSSQDGEWHFLETLDRADGPYLSLDYAELSPATEDGYWIYSRSYDCKLDCE